jgi:hypothetical protein
VRARISIAVALLALAAGVIVLLSQRAPQRTGINGVPPGEYVYTIGADQTACQPSVVPAGTRYVAFFTGTYGLPGPPLRLELRGAHVDVRAPGGYPGAQTRVAIPELRQRTPGDVCLTNLGPAPLALAGVPQGYGFTSTVDGHKMTEPLHLVFYGATSSWWARAPVVASRVGLLAFGGTGSWLFWALVALMLAAATAAVTLIARETRG